MTPSTTASTRSLTPPVARSTAAPAMAKPTPPASPVRYWSARTAWPRIRWASIVPVSRRRSAASVGIEGNGRRDSLNDRVGNQGEIASPAVATTAAIAVVLNEVADETAVPIAVSSATVITATKPGMPPPRTSRASVQTSTAAQAATRACVAPNSIKLCFPPTAIAPHAAANATPNAAATSEGPRR